MILRLAGLALRFVGWERFRPTDTAQDPPVVLPFNTPAAGGTVTVDYQVAASSSDGHQQSIPSDSGRAVTGGGSCVLTDVRLQIGSHSSGDEWSGSARFINVALPQGVTIQSASLQMRADSSYSASPNVIKLYASCEDSDNAAALSTSSGDLNASNRPRTTATAVLDVTTITGGSWYTWDITAPVQELVNRAAWASGNALVVLIDTHEDTTTAEWQDWESYDGDPAGAPKISVTYMSSGSSTDVSGGDAGQGSETGLLSSLQTSVDSGSGSESYSLAANLSPSDGEVLSEAVTLSANLLTAEMGTAQEAIDLLLSYVTGEALSAQEQAWLAVAQGGSDPSIFTETALLTLSWLVSDYGTSEQKVLVDAIAHATDTSLVTERVLLSLEWYRTESILLNEVGFVSIAYVLGDQGTAGDRSALEALIFPSDSAIESSQASLYADIVTRDTGLLTEQADAEVSGQQTDGGDSGSGSESSLLTALLLPKDQFTAQETALITAVIVGADGAASFEQTERGLMLHVSDVGRLFEAAYVEEGEEPPPSVIVVGTGLSRSLRERLQLLMQQQLAEDLARYLVWRKRKQEDELIVLWAFSQRASRQHVWVMEER